MAQKHTSRFARLPVRTRLTVLFVIVSIIPVLAIGFLSLRVSSETTLEKGVQEQLSRLEFIDYRTTQLIRQKHKDTLLIAFGDQVRAYFDDAARETRPLIEVQTKRQLISLYNKQESTAVMLLNLEGEGLLYGLLQTSSVRQVDKRDMPWAAPGEFKLFDRWGDPIFDGDEPVVPYERLVLALSDNRPVGRLVIYVKEALFGELYLDYEREGGSEFFIVNERGIIASATDKSLYAQPVERALGFSLDECTLDSGHFIVGRNTITYRNNRERNLYFIERTPTAELTSGFWPIVQLTVLVALLCFIVCVALGMLLSGSFTKPLYQLIDRVTPYDPVGKPRAMTKNEIAILNDQYDRILERLETVIGEYYEEQKNKKEAQIKALEFQINPHFLYNTLSTIVWLIDAGEDKTAIRVTKDLSAFFRLSISKGREYITLREELNHVALYIDIQKARYADCISVSYDVPEDAMDVSTPKLILQPLVENSIIHAMQTRSDKTCHICIAAWREGRDVIIEVCDNGDAIKPGTIEDMNRFLYHRDQASVTDDYGIGISNVHDRIVMSFGEGYGLRYRRENGETVATLRIGERRGG